MVVIIGFRIGDASVSDPPCRGGAFLRHHCRDIVQQLENDPVPAKAGFGSGSQSPGKKRRQRAATLGRNAACAPR